MRIYCKILIHNESGLIDCEIKLKGLKWAKKMSPKLQRHFPIVSI